MTGNLDMLTAYDQGFSDGLRAYAINRDGEQYVGSPELNLKMAIGGRAKTWSYSPPTLNPDAGLKDDHAYACQCDLCKPTEGGI